MKSDGYIITNQDIYDCINGTNGGDPLGRTWNMVKNQAPQNGKCLTHTDATNLVYLDTSAFDSGWSTNQLIKWEELSPQSTYGSHYYITTDSFSNPDGTANKNSFTYSLQRFAGPVEVCIIPAILSSAAGTHTSLIIKEGTTELANKTINSSTSITKFNISYGGTSDLSIYTSGSGSDTGSYLVYFYVTISIQNIPLAPVNLYGKLGAAKADNGDQLMLAISSQIGAGINLPVNSLTTSCAQLYPEFWICKGKTVIIYFTDGDVGKAYINIDESSLCPTNSPTYCQYSYLSSDNGDISVTVYVTGGSAVACT